MIKPVSRSPLRVVYRVPTGHAMASSSAVPAGPSAVKAIRAALSAVRKMRQLPTRRLGPRSAQSIRARDEHCLTREYAFRAQLAKS